jgi:uncharacterized C2H2 Zn-finger protein
MQSSSYQPYKCNICGMVFVNSQQLGKHQIVVHIDKMFQCQSCNKVFDNKQKFERHAIEAHSRSQYTPDDASNKIGKKQAEIHHQQQIDNSNLESTLLKRTDEEEKVRKITRGPYRKAKKIQ